MISEQHLISELAQAHGVDAETIVRAAVHDFAFGRSKGQQADAIRVARLDAAHGDEKRHSAPNEVTKNVTTTNPR